MPDTRRLARRRRRLLAQDPHCYWCGCKVIDCAPANGRLPYNAATIDHLNSRVFGPRPRVLGQATTVLSCLKCNLRHAKYETLGRVWPPEYLTCVKRKNMLANVRKEAVS